jgi:hypothetical protein
MSARCERSELGLTTLQFLFLCAIKLDGSSVAVRRQLGAWGTRYGTEPGYYLAVKRLRDDDLITDKKELIGDVAYSRYSLTAKGGAALERVFAIVKQVEGR